MTDKELKKLKRPELLELLLYLRRELDIVKQENESLRSQLSTYTAQQGDVNRELLEMVRKTAQQVHALCEAQNIENQAAGFDEAAEVTEPDTAAEEKADAENAEAETEK